MRERLTKELRRQAIYESAISLFLSEGYEHVIETAWARIQPYLEDLNIPFDTCTRLAIHEMMELFTNHPSMSNVFYCGGGETFMRRRHEALYGKLGSKLLDALMKRHPDAGPEISWTVTMLIALISDMAHIASEHVDAELLREFENRVATFAAAGLKAHLDDPLHLSTYTLE